MQQSSTFTIKALKRNDCLGITYLNHICTSPCLTPSCIQILNISHLAVFPAAEPFFFSLTARRKKRSNFIFHFSSSYRPQPLGGSKGPTHNPSPGKRFESSAPGPPDRCTSQVIYGAPLQICILAAAAAAAGEEFAGRL